MLEQLVIRLKEKSWVLMLLLMAVVVCLVGAQCEPPPTSETVTVETVVVKLELAKVIGEPVSVELKNRQPLQLDIVETETGRPHFRLEIDTDDYPDGNDFELEVMAIPREKIAGICQGQEGCQEYPEVSGVTEGGRLIILVDSTQYVAANPYAFSVTGIDEFANPVSASISVDRPEEIPREQWEQQDHGIIIYHEDSYEPLIERFPAKLIQEGGFYQVTSSDDPDDPNYAPIYRCCSMHADCSSEPACLECR